MAPPSTDSAIASYDRQEQPSAKNPFLFNDKGSPLSPPPGTYKETGIASWYGSDFQGKRTSSGERFDMHEMTAAHRKLPMNTLLLVTNLENGREAVVRVNDRGPFAKGRILDLSRSAAKALKLFGKGTARVKVVALPDPDKPAQEPLLDHTGDISDSNFYVQVGAFTRQKNAQHLQKRFMNDGHKTTISKVAGKKATIYRVLVFAGSDLSKALVAKKTLQQQGHKGVFVLTR